jgi:hypothetical protein
MHLLFMTAHATGANPADCHINIGMTLQVKYLSTVWSDA